ncbi:hypothetical protein [Prosthecobacter sp.]|uniref:hypothetical protein n=1 Tax=Prosthecobacter sp. TaxID=1965333 RepID=UPI0037852C38
MTSLTDVLHHLVRRGLVLRIETTGTLFIYDPRCHSRVADAVAGQPLPAEAQARNARAERRALDEARHALISAITISTGVAVERSHATTTLCSAGTGTGSTGGTRTMSTAPAAAVKPAAAKAEAVGVRAPGLPAPGVSTPSAAGAPAAPALAPGAAISPAKPAVQPGTTPAASATAGNVLVLPDHDGSFVPTGAQWRGITWLDVPGHDDSSKKLNFALLKRGMLHGHKECAGLQGAALRQRLSEISGRNRSNSQQRREQSRQSHESHPR